MQRVANWPFPKEWRLELNEKEKATLDAARRIAEKAATHYTEGDEQWMEWKALAMYATYGND